MVNFQRADPRFDGQFSASVNSHEAHCPEIASTVQVRERQVQCGVGRFCRGDYVEGRAITLPRWQGWAKAAKRKLDEAMEKDAELRQAA